MARARRSTASGRCPITVPKVTYTKGRWSPAGHQFGQRAGGRGGQVEPARVGPRGGVEGVGERAEEGRGADCLSYTWTVALDDRRHHVQNATFDDGQRDPDLSLGDPGLVSGDSGHVLARLADNEPPATRRTRRVSARAWPACSDRRTAPSRSGRRRLRYPRCVPAPRSCRRSPGVARLPPGAAVPWTRPARPETGERPPELRDPIGGRPGRPPRAAGDAQPRPAKRPATPASHRNVDDDQPARRPTVPTSPRTRPQPDPDPQRVNRRQCSGSVRALGALA